MSLLPIVLLLHTEDPLYSSISSTLYIIDATYQYRYDINLEVKKTEQTPNHTDCAVLEARSRTFLINSNGPTPKTCSRCKSSS